MIIDTEKNWNHFKDILLSSHRELFWRKYNNYPGGQTS